MQIIVSNTTLNVLDARRFRYANGKLVLQIKIPQTEIAHDELKALLKNNKGDIVKMDGEKVLETFSGFSYTLTITDHNDVYDVEIECVSEVESKLEDTRTALEETKKFIQEQSEVLKSALETLDFLMEGAM